MPVWQEVYEELKEYGFTVITVALDKDAEAPRPWIEKANPTHPSLIDTQHLIADLYGVVNVPTVLWIDEEGTIVRPNDTAFATDTFKHITGLDATKMLNTLRAWVKGEVPGFDRQKSQSYQSLPTAEMQNARAEFGLGKWLYEQGRNEAANAHFIKAGELAPHDWTITRGSMPMRGVDSFGPEFRQMLGKWVEAGNQFYHVLPE